MKKNDNTVPNLDDDNVVISLDAFRKSKETAENMLKEHKTDDIERVLEKLEEKLKRIPKVGKHLANIPVYVSMIRSYIRKEYTALPIGAAVGVLTALIYFLSPIDLIPDAVPGLGYLDDAAVLSVIAMFVEADVEAYKEWKEEQFKS